MLKLQLQGRRFERLVVVGEDPDRSAERGRRFVRVRCDCGAEKSVAAAILNFGGVRSCGCLKNDTTAARNRKHGFTGTGTYRSWKAMIRRCNAPAAMGFERYGGRGIPVCDRWRGEHGFENFLADMGERPLGKTLDRIDNEVGYEPSNCRWASRREQCINQRRNPRYLIDGETLTLAEWCERFGADPGRSRRRIAMGWDPREALATPSLGSGHRRRKQARSA